MVSLLSFWLCCRLSFLLPSSVRTEAIAQLGKWHCRTCLWWLGFWRVTWIRVGQQANGSSSSSKGSSSNDVQAVGIVSNHISWCDILLHMSHSFPCFVARAQTRNQPIIGIIR
jgi:1-acyl-sn-glycerol-3-phosphate acyltransferase